MPRKAAHAASPEDGVNAAAHLVELLCKVFKKDQMGSFFRFIHEKIGLCTDGEKIGVKMSDEPAAPRPSTWAWSTWTGTLAA